MKHRTNKPGSEPADRSETSPASPEKSPSETIEELLKFLKEDGWAINPGEFSAILPGLGPQKPKPEEDEQDKQEEE